VAPLGDLLNERLDLRSRSADTRVALRHRRAPAQYRCRNRRTDEGEVRVMTLRSKPTAELELAAQTPPELDAGTRGDNGDWIGLSALLSVLFVVLPVAVLALQTR